MGYQDTDSTGNKGYTFDKLPENIRQMGEQPEKKRVYIEDYVVTYMHQIFRKKQEKAIVILVGKTGEREAADTSFVYGALEVELDIPEGAQKFNAETWDKIYELISRHFQGAQVLGWGCGVSMWNSRIDNAVQQIQKKYFKQEGKIFFLEDLSEKEEKIFKWENGALKKLPGYMIYYEKNPQMQDYMLLGQPKKSFESAYQDKVTANVRQAVQHKEEKAEPRKLAVYTAGVFLLLLTILGANLLMQSTRKIDDLEKTIETLSNAAISVTEAPQQIEAKKNKKEKASGEKKKAADTTGNTTAVPSAADIQSEKEDEQNSTENPLVTELFKNTATPKVLEELVTPKPTAKPVKVKNTPKPESTETKQQEKVAMNQSAASYIVKAGDTLSQIVWRQYHTLSYMEAIKKVNHIEDGDKIMEGQIILLPAY